jgi:hypothetical protein
MDPDEGEGEEQAPPEPELSNEEKLAALKEALVAGEMGPKKFDDEFQKIWLVMKAMPEEEGRPGLRRAQTSRLAIADVN